MKYFYKRIKRVIESRILKQWGSFPTKKLIWDQEFSTGQWDFLENTKDDPVYNFMEKYCNNGNILDLGCGLSNTGIEMDITKYKMYTGVDISGEAIQRAILKAKDHYRDEKNEYFCSDISSFVPERKYDIILFRESIYYIPKYKIGRILNHYSKWLKSSGLFIVEMYDRRKYKSIVRLIEKRYHVVDRLSCGHADIILVFM